MSARKPATSIGNQPFGHRSSALDPWPSDLSAPPRATA